MIHPEVAAKMSDEQLFKALERTKAVLRQRVRAPDIERTASEIHELRQLVLDYDRVLMQRLRAALESLN